MSASLSRDHTRLTAGGGRGYRPAVSPGEGLRAGAQEEKSHARGQRRARRLRVHGPRPQQRLAPGVPVLLPRAHPAAQGHLRPRRGEREEGGLPARLGGVGDRLARGGGPSRHRRRGRGDPGRQPRRRSRSPPRRRARPSSARSRSPTTCAEAEGDAKGRPQGGRPPHDLPQLPPRPGRHAGPRAGRLGQARPHLPLPRDLPAGLAGRPADAPLLALPEGEVGLGLARRHPLPLARPRPLRPRQRGDRGGGRPSRPS